MVSSTSGGRSASKRTDNRQCQEGGAYAEGEGGKSAKDGSSGKGLAGCQDSLHRSAVHGLRDGRHGRQDAQVERIRR